ncbi:MAG: hypothetical protein KF725_11580 [Cyclobacteriaceae bacterium]|nr:hypothetical protein [Cyclobacteriaceae bacterium]
MREVVRYFTSIKYHTLKLVLVFTFASANAQLQYHTGIQLPIQRNESTFKLVSTQSAGLILFRPLNLQESTVQFIHVDTSFNQKWAGLLPIDKKFVYSHHSVTKQYAYFLFHHREFAEINFQVYQLELATGNFTRHFVNNFIPFLPTHFETVSGGLIIGGYFAGKIPVVLFYDFTTRKSKILPALFNEPGELLQINTSADPSFSVLISARNAQRQKTLWIKNYNGSAELVENKLLNPSENQSLLFGQVISLANGTQYIAGTYGNRNSEFSKGLYIAHLENDLDSIRYYPFSELENFFSYLKVQRAERIKERIKRKTVKGKKIRLQYRFLVHEFIPHKDEYLLLGEAFYPVYRTLDRNYMGGGLAPGSAVFDGYKYTHAVIIGFDKNGKLRWDNSFEINDIKTFTLTQFVKLDIKPNKIILFYLFNDKIRYKVIRNSQLLEQATFNAPALSDEFADTDEGVSSVDHWYNGYFTISGTNYTTSRRWGRNSQRAFFVTKISYR